MKKIWIYENSRIPKLLSWFISIKAITIYPFIFVNGKVDSQRLQNHEMIHIAQQRELFLVGFYLLYGYYWVKNLLWHKMPIQTAYREIPFEREAYHGQNFDNYLDTRQRMAWRKWS